MSLIQFAQNKDAINFKKALEEKIQGKVEATLSETKVIVASNLLGEAGGVQKTGTPGKPSHGEVSGGVKPHMSKVWKKPAVGKHGASAPKPHMPEEVQVDEKVITPGSVEHMTHAVHACASGECPATHTRGTFQSFDHPHYSIHRDNGNIDPDKHENAYHVLGAGGHHKFSVAHTKHGIDVKHVGQVG